MVADAVVATADIGQSVPRKVLFLLSVATHGRSFSNGCVDDDIPEEANGVRLERYDTTVEMSGAMCCIFSASTNSTAALSLDIHRSPGVIDARTKRS